MILWLLLIYHVGFYVGVPTIQRRRSLRLLIHITRQQSAFIHVLALLALHGFVDVGVEFYHHGAIHL